MLVDVVDVVVAVVVATAAGAVYNAAAAAGGGTFCLKVSGLPRPILIIIFFFFLPAFFETLVVEFRWKALLVLIDFYLVFSWL